MRPQGKEHPAAADDDLTGSICYLHFLRTMSARPCGKEQPEFHYAQTNKHSSILNNPMQMIPLYSVRGC